jgi:hypothetical protein
MVATAPLAKTRGMPPPDENTAVDPTGAAWVVWLVIVGPGLLFATLTCVRRVAPGELVLVVRRGEVVRVRRNGLVARWPGLERFEPVTTDPRVVPLVIRSRTSDGVDVVALADLTVQVRDVEPGTAYVPPAQAARLAEDTVARAVEQLEVESLVDDLEALETRWPGVLARQLPAGTAATALAVTEVEARLTGDPG